MRSLDRLLARFDWYLRWRHRQLMRRLKEREHERRSTAAMKGWETRRARWNV